MKENISWDSLSMAEFYIMYTTIQIDLSYRKSPQKWRPKKTQMMKKNFISEIKIILSINS